MDNKEILRNIILEDSIENISLAEDHFMIKFGDILNTETSTGNQYYLLDTYIEVPYSFNPSELSLHRGILNEYECREDNDYDYSGFVHYSGVSFCYGKSGVDYVCNTIRDEGLDSDKFNMFIIKLKTYLSVSSHNTVEGFNGYKMLDLPDNDLACTYKLLDYVTLDGFNYPSKLLKTEENLSVKKILYDKPYLDVLWTHHEKAFRYDNEEIIPITVKHEVSEEKKTVETKIRVNVPAIIDTINIELIRKLENEVNNKKRITFKDLLHKLPNKLSRVDGCLYI